MPKKSNAKPKAAATALGHDVRNLQGTEQLSLYNLPRSPRKRVTIKAIGCGGQPIIETGQVARVLVALVHAGDEGLTPLATETWAIRLSHHVGELRKRHGLTIAKLWGEHDYGRHARYVLRSSVKVKEVTLA